MDKETSAQYFLSSLSHEIRTPLNGIVGYTQLLAQTKLDKNQKMYLHATNQCCVQLIELVNDILDFSRLATGKGQLHKQCFSPNEIIDEVNSAIGYRIKEKKQRCRYILSPDLPKYIISDKMKIVQIVVNLVSNANKFTPTGGRIIVSISPKDGNTIEFSVEDNGIGIDEKEQAKLFQPFVQLQETLTQNGTGLGLAICKKLSQLLGGDISVESSKGQGATFTFTIKYEQYEQFEQNIVQNSSALKDKFVLVVTNNVDDRLSIGDILFDCRARPIICSTGQEALKLLGSGRYSFSAVIFDDCLPDIVGTDLHREIRDIDSEIPLIVLTDATTVDFNRAIIKPVNKVKLLETLQKAIGQGDISTCELNAVVTKPEKKDNDIRILVAEDVSYNLDMLVKMLNSLGYNKIDTAGNGAEAIEHLQAAQERNKPYTVLLLDLKMPKVDGFEVAKYLQEQKWPYPHVAVITASVLDSDRDRCKQYGVKYFLLKPVNMSQLKSVLNRLIYGTS